MLGDQKKGVGSQDVGTVSAAGCGKKGHGWLFPRTAKESIACPGSDPLECAAGGGGGFNVGAIASDRIIPNNRAGRITGGIEAKHRV